MFARHTKGMRKRMNEREIESVSLKEEEDDVLRALITRNACKREKRNIKFRK